MKDTPEMASQDASNGAPLWYQPEQESLRLLELPPEVLEAIDRDDNSAAHISIKSAADPAASHAVLCTPHKTWQIRQVQTSNSVFLLRPHSVQEAHEGEMPAVGVAAFATCGSTLETVQIDAQKDSAKLKTPLQLVQESVPSFFKIGMSSSAISKGQVFSSLPYSDGELDQAWNSLCCFEYEGAAYRPEAVTLVEVWSELFKNSSRQAVELSAEFNPSDLQDDLSYDDYPKQLFDAVVRNLLDPTHIGPKVRLDKDTTIGWVGKCLFDSKMHDQNRNQCVAAWQGLVPEEWRQEVSVATYDALSAKDSATASKFVELNAKDGGDAGKKPTLANRNWHERLKRTRR